MKRKQARENMETTPPPTPSEIDHANAFALVDQCLVSAANLLTTILLVRWLGLEAFGAFSLVWIAVMFVVSVQQALISTPLLTIAPTMDRMRWPGYFRATVALEMLLSTIVFLSTAAGFQVLERGYVAPLLNGLAVPVAAVICAKQAHSYVRSLFFATGRPDKALVNDAIAYLGQLALFVGFYLSDWLSLETTLWAVCIPVLVAVLAWFFQFGAFNFEKAEVFAAARRHWASSRWLLAVALTQWFSANAFIVAAGVLLGAGAVGTLKAAQTILGLVHVLFLAMENVVPVRAAVFYSRGGGGVLKEYLWSIARLGAPAVVLALAVIALFAKPIIAIAYGTVNSEIIWVLRVFAIHYLFIFPVLLLRIYFRTIEETRPIFLSYAVAAILSVLAANSVVNIFKIGGAVGGVVVGQVLMLGLLSWSATSKSP